MVHFLIFQAERPAEPVGRGYRVRARARGRDLCRERGLLFCSTRAYKRDACFQRGEAAAAAGRMFYTHTHEHTHSESLYVIRMKPEGSPPEH